jgi:hypothetical protein
MVQKELGEGIGHGDAWLRSRRGSVSSLVEEAEVKPGLT